MIDSLDPAFLGLTLFDKSSAGAIRTAKLGNSIPGDCASMEWVSFATMKLAFDTPFHTEI